MFGKSIKELRQTHNISQNQLAKIFNVGQSTVANWETEQREPNYALLCKIADFFDVSLDYLLGRTDEKESAPADWQGLTKEEHDFITILRTLSSDERKLVLAYMGGMHDLLSLKNDTVLIDGQEYVKISK